MANIPLFNNGMHGPAPGGGQQPILQPSKRIQVDPSGVFAAAREATVQPLMPKDMYAGDAVAGNAWGEALQTLGKMGVEIVQKEMQAKSEIELEDARSLIESSYAAHEEWKLANPGNPDAWRERWQKTWGDTVKQIEEKGYTGATRRRLDPLVKRYGDRYTINESSAATVQTLRLAKSALESRLLTSMDSQDEGNFEDALGRLASGGHILADDVTRMRFQFRDTGRQKASDEAKNLYSSAILSGNEEGIEQALALGAERGGWSPSDVELMRVKGTQDLADVRERTINEAERDALGEVAYRMASGEPVLPIEIEKMVKEGKVSQRAAASFMEAAKRAAHPLPGEWGEFIDKVATYDPDDDPKSAKAAGLLSEMITKNPDRAQMAQFNAVFEKAQKDNADSGKKVETYALVAGRNQIREAFSKSGMFRAWSKDLEMALQDPAKLEKFGIPPEKAQEIKALMQGGTFRRYNDKGILEDRKAVVDVGAAFQEFKQAAVTRHDPARAKGAGLSDWEYNLFEQAATSDVYGNSISREKEMSAAFDQSILLQKFDAWHVRETGKNKGVPPDELTVKKKLGEMLNGVFQGRGARANLPKSAAVTGGNRITSYGYDSDEWADSNSAVGIGAWVPDDEAQRIRRGEESTYKLKENDFAVSPDVEAQLRKAGVKPGDTVKMKLADDTILSGRWMYRTANDQQARSLGLPPLRGRWDVYSPGGKSVKDGVKVVGFATK